VKSIIQLITSEIQAISGKLEKLNSPENDLENQLQLLKTEVFLQDEKLKNIEI